MNDGGGVLSVCVDSDTVYTKRRMEKNGRLLAGGCYGFGNLGDEAMGIALDDALKENGISQHVFLVVKPLAAFVGGVKAVVGGPDD